MVLLTFTPESSEKILAGTKCATTRPLTPHWQRLVRDFAKGRSIKLQLWRGSPRNGGTRLLPEDLEPIRVDAAYGAEYDGEMFLKDGFERSEDLVDRLNQFYEPRFCDQCNRYQLGSHFIAQRKANNAHVGGPLLLLEEASHWFDTAQWAFIEFPTPLAVSSGSALEEESARGEA